MPASTCPVHFACVATCPCLDKCVPLVCVCVCVSVQLACKCMQTSEIELLCCLSQCHICPLTQPAVHTLTMFVCLAGGGTYVAYIHTLEGEMKVSQLADNPGCACSGHVCGMQACLTTRDMAGGDGVLVWLRASICGGPDGDQCWVVSMGCWRSTSEN